MNDPGTLKFTIFNAKKDILSKIAVEWRQVLCHRKLSLNIEMPDFHSSGAKNSLGVLSLEIAVHGFNSNLIYLEKEIVEKYLKQKEEKNALRVVRFYNYASGWW
jgi:hypothetical protein